MLEIRRFLLGHLNLNPKPGVPDKKVPASQGLEGLFRIQQSVSLRVQRTQ